MDITWFIQNRLSVRIHSTVNRPDNEFKAVRAVALRFEVCVCVCVFLNTADQLRFLEAIANNINLGFLSPLPDKMN